MNPAYLLNPGELRTFFEGWELIHYVESRTGDSSRRAEAEVIARKT